MLLLDMTPSGNEFQRKMLLDHSSKIRNIFILLLLLVPIALWVGNYLSCNGKSGDPNGYLQNVAMIIVNGGDTNPQGTAFLVSDQSGQTQGYMFTARHVIDATVDKNVCLMFPFIKDDKDEPLITTATIVWTTNITFDGNDVNTLRYDVALLKLDDLSVLPPEVSGFMVGTDPALKENVSIYGFPNSEGYAVDGQISNTEFKGTSDLITLSFQIDHGLSGAPIYNEETGEALGIAIASATDTDIQNIAITLKRALDLMEQDGVKKLLSE
ncbi:serine protease [Parabacteroides goldsteinii]|uniref:trypsin-like serine peptidase n=1 Tax=Parabacteroides goldsteinii TaxID=328812 RepID=UPI001CCA9080|nr:serine protease [Parabacteroides goldsteinii]UBD77259.1 serine protease [Parabacteroides goldsteinii]